MIELTYVLKRSLHSMEVEGCELQKITVYGNISCIMTSVQLHTCLNYPRSPEPREESQRWAKHHVFALTTFTFGSKTSIYIGNPRLVRLHRLIKS